MGYFHFEAEWTWFSASGYGLPNRPTNPIVGRAPCRHVVLSHRDYRPRPTSTGFPLAVGWKPRFIARFDVSMVSKHWQLWWVPDPLGSGCRVSRDGTWRLVCFARASSSHSVLEFALSQDWQFAPSVSLSLFSPSQTGGRRLTGALQRNAAWDGTENDSR